MQQILSHTPLYVWAILAFLVYRGLAAARTRELAPRALFIVPVLMLGLSLQGIVTAFGAGGGALPAWVAGAVLVALPALRWSGSRIAAAGAAGKVRVAGSWSPLAAMLAIFALKYAVAVTMALRPALVHEASFGAAVCGLYGMLNGYFIARMLRNLRRLRALGMPALAA
ncbi:hypothetical protein B0920_06810 [Massilia sp. KIM]|nr:hypothetical protein B0920_06810 [Massilia sp. KIM]